MHFNPNIHKPFITCHGYWRLIKDKEFRNGEDAVRLAQRLCKITQYKQPLALDALAAAYAETGRFDDAVLTAKKALKLALDQGPEELVEGLKKRLQLYEKRHPYRQTPSGESSS